MATPIKPAQRVGIRCFCGNAIRVNPRAKRAIICTQCHQPLPLQAIRLALEARPLVPAGR